MKWLLFLAVLIGTAVFVFSKQKKGGGNVRPKEGAGRRGKWIAHPIPVGDMEVPLWNGQMAVEFTYRGEDDSKRRVKLDLRKVIVKEVRRVYLVGEDVELNATQQFFVHRIETMVLVKSKRFDLHDFMEQLGVNLDLYEYDERYDEAYKEHNNLCWRASLKTLWESADPVDVTFSYPAAEGREKRSLGVTEVTQGDMGQIYLGGICRTKNEVRHFRDSKILTKITCEGKKYGLMQFLTERLGVVIEAE